MKRPTPQRSLRRAATARFATAVLLATSCTFAHASDTLPAPEGAEIVVSSDDEKEFCEISLGAITKRTKPLANSTHKVAGTSGYIGKRARHHYKVTSQGSGDLGAPIHTSYLQWLDKNGFTILLDAQGNSAMEPGGTSWALRVYGALPTEIATELSGTADKNLRRYLVAERHDGEEHRVASILINQRRVSEVRVQVDVIDVDTQATAQAFPQRSELTIKLGAGTPVHLSGIRYIGMKSMARDSVDRVLEEITAVLSASPQLRVAVQARVVSERRPGSAAPLAQARAQAIVDLLIEEHGVDGERLETRVASDPGSPEGIVLIAIP